MQQQKHHKKTSTTCLNIPNVTPNTHYEVLKIYQLSFVLHRHTKFKSTVLIAAKTTLKKDIYAMLENPQLTPDTQLLWVTNRIIIYRQMNILISLKCQASELSVIKLS